MKDKMRAVKLGKYVGEKKILIMAINGLMIRRKNYQKRQKKDLKLNQIR